MVGLRELSAWRNTVERLCTKFPGARRLRGCILSSVRKSGGKTIVSLKTYDAKLADAVNSYGDLTNEIIKELRRIFPDCDIAMTTIYRDEELEGIELVQLADRVFGGRNEPESL